MLETRAITLTIPASWEQRVNRHCEGYQKLPYWDMGVVGVAQSVRVEGHLESKEKKTFASFAKCNC